MMSTIQAPLSQRPSPRTSRFPVLAGIAAAAILVAGCAHHHGMHGGPQAQAQLAPTRGNTTSGVVRFTPAGGDLVQVSVRVTGLVPGREHGFHVHDKGDCSSPDGMSAGGHFNPGGKKHGHPGPDSHTGDMPALRADASGTAEARFTMIGSLAPDAPDGLVGRAVIVHADPDDYATQPTGNSGARLACGVITRATP